MIGVIVEPAEECTVREFFELFKTPWEFFRSERRYDVVLCAGNGKLEGVVAKLLLLYASDETAFDAGQKIQIRDRLRCPTLSYGESRFPIYADCVSFGHEGAGVLTGENSQECVAFVDRFGERVFARVGYDLFREVHFLLTQGQPPAKGGIPTLDLHIAFLRDLITGCGVPLIEIPPVPDNHPFIACLTHDIDHASILRHKFDHTTFGFLYRATLGSALNLARGRLSLRKLLTNWAAATKMPFVYLGLARDFWFEFDRYVEIENGKPSTFFAIPFEGNAGRSPEGMAPRARASRYDISHIAAKIPYLKSAGCEIGLHGIDAWVDSSQGRKEGKRITGFSGTTEIGVRMHWLYVNHESPAKLESAGFSYDSTIGYNETVGYRAGTTQAFKPLSVTRMLELPLHVMDTALFYPRYLDLSPGEAWSKLVPVLDNVDRLGGALTINWHDRSIAPERLWGDFYVRLLDELAARGAWFGTAGQVVSWFRKRRSATFEVVGRAGDTVHVKVDGNRDELPGLRLRLHPARQIPHPVGAKNYNEISFRNSIDVRLPN